MRYAYKRINVYHYVPKSVYDRVEFMVRERPLVLRAVNGASAFQEKRWFLIFTEDRYVFPLPMCMDGRALISFLVLFIICLPMCLSLYSFIFTNLSAVSLSVDLNLSGGNANLPCFSTLKKYPLAALPEVENLTGRQKCACENPVYVYFINTCFSLTLWYSLKCHLSSGLGDVEQESDRASWGWEDSGPFVCRFPLMFLCYTNAINKWVLH